jgi:hypothetical protein
VRVYLALPQFGPANETGRALADAIRDAGHSLVNDPLDARRAFPLAQSERSTFVEETDRLLAADLLVADASQPDAGIGWAIAWFLAKGRLVVLCCSKDARASLAPLLAGNPSPWQKLVTYDDAAALGRQVTEILTANG